MTLMPAFDRCSEAAKIVGKLVVGYSELEFDWMLCVSSYIGDLDTSIRVLYRIRSESNRFEVGDALLRPYYAKLSLSVEYDRAFEALLWCKKVRNTYAHCHWADQDGDLFLTDLESLAKTRVGKKHLLVKFVPTELLRDQEKYFSYCQSILNYLYYEGRLRSKQIKLNPFPKTKVVRQPPVFSQKKKAFNIGH